MSYYFASGQIAKMASRIEEYGSKFYQFLADKDFSTEIKKIFSNLAYQELNHKLTFLEIAQKEIAQNVIKEYSIDIASLINIAIEDMQKNVFNIEKISQNQFDQVSAIDMGIKAELESIRIYNEIKSKFTENFTRILDEIIIQEQEHYRILSETKNSFTRL